MQATWSASARSLLERADTIAAERRAATTTLHLAAALLEAPSDIARLLAARGLRLQDMRTATKVHGETDGTFDRVKNRARKIALGRGTEVSGQHLLTAALTEPNTALAAMLSQLGCAPNLLAAEIYRAPPVAPPPPPPVARVVVPVAPASSGARAPAPSAPSPARAAPAPAPRPRAARPPVRPASVARGFDPRAFPVLAACLRAPGGGDGDEAFVGRARELERVRDALGRREGRGALLVGPGGAGKSALVRALARASQTPVAVLRHADLAARMRGANAERVRALGDEIARAEDRVLVALDPVAPWFTTRDVPDEVVLELRAALASARTPWVGTATAEEARRLVDVEPWVERAAVKIDVGELAPDDVRAAVRGHCAGLAAYHGVAADEALSLRAADLADRYLGGRVQPDRTLAVLDLALTRAKRVGATALAASHLAEVVAELGGMPVARVAETDAERLLALERHLAARVVGHADALARVAHVLRRNAVGFRGARPIGTFLFLGPTGVGKTETAKAIAEALYPGEDALTRFDMAEYAEAHAVARLIGAPPGYVGYNDGGQLTEAVRRRPYQLVLLDEIEKAHRDVLESLLAVLDEGRMTDGRGRTVDFRHTVVVMTSNLGAEAYRDRATARTIGFGGSGASDRAPNPGAGDPLRDAVVAAARAALPPELWNRIDEPVVYGPLGGDEVAEIARRMLASLCGALRREQGIEAEATAGLVALLLARGGYEPALGARPMRRAIARLVEAPLAEAVLRGSLRRGDRVRLDAEGDAVALRRDGVGRL